MRRRAYFGCVVIVALCGTARAQGTPHDRDIELLVSDANSAPPEGPPFFTPCGWQPIEVKSILKAAGKIGRLPFAMRLFAMLPESDGAQGGRPWSAVCLFARS